MIGRWLYLWYRRILIGLPACVRSLAVSWHRNLDTIVEEGATTTVPGLLDFDGVDDWVNFGSSVFDASGDKAVNFKLYLSKESGYLASNYGNVVFSLHYPATFDGFLVYLWDNELRINVGRNFPTYYGGNFSLSGLSDRILDCTITKGLNNFVSFTIDGVAQTSLGNTSLSLNNRGIGYAQSGVSYIDDALVWDISIYDDPAGTNTLIHNWTGQPNGDQDIAWADTVGVGALTVIGSPSTIDLEVAGDAGEYVKDSIGVRTDDVYYGQYLTTASGQINFLRGNNPGVNTFSYIDPSDGSLVEDVDIPVGGLYTIPANGICEITTSDGSHYPVCERAGTVLHDVNENTVHISVATPTWAETLYGSDFLNQCGFLNKELSDALGFDWETEVDRVNITLDDNCLVPLAQWEYGNLQDVDGNNLLDNNGDQLQVRINI